MKQFTLYNPQHPSTRQRLIRKYESPQKANGYDFYLIKEDDHFIVYTERLHVYPSTSLRFGVEELIADQFEMPFSGICWFIDVIEQKFFKSPEDGGLPANKISYEEIVGGEDLHIIRAVTAGCEHPGYVITNGSRRSYISSISLQTLELSDPWLFKNGLMDFLKELADAYEAGQL